MTDHLPDCDDYAFSGAGFHPKCERICICRQVRRIEHRVFQEQIEGRQSGSRQPDEDYAYKTGSDNGFDAGLNAGLDAAREAVVALCWRKQYEGFVSTVDPQRVLAAIDALKEGK